MRIGIVGAGIAGLACARGLAKNGHEVVVCDKGRGPGGRIASRHIPTDIGDVWCDIGAQYFTAHSDPFRQQVDAWIVQGVVSPWPAAGNDAYVGVPSMRTLAENMAQELTIDQTTCVKRIDLHGAGWRLALEDETVVDVDVAIIATPAEQAAALLATIAPDLAKRAQAVPSQPCWTATFVFERALPTRQDCWRGTDIIGWAARNNAKPGRAELECWVVQATPDWSLAHMTAYPSWVATTLKIALSNILGFDLPSAVSASSHLWRFARSGTEGSGAIFDRERRLGICGDWLIAPRLEAAWQSGSLLALSIGIDEDHNPDLR